MIGQKIRLVIYGIVTYLAVTYRITIIYRYYLSLLPIVTTY